MTLWYRKAAPQMGQTHAKLGCSGMEPGGVGEEEIAEIAEILPQPGKIGRSGGPGIPPEQAKTGLAGAPLIG
jgi:hypothetical protein